MSSTISPVQKLKLENDLHEKLRNMLESDHARRETVRIFRVAKKVGTLNSLLGRWKFGADFELKEHIVLRKGKSSELSVNLFQGMQPDIVLRSNHSQQNRIIFDAKVYAKDTHNKKDESQVLRYFLHLLVTSDAAPDGFKDIPRGMFLVAPASWFNSKKSANWDHLLNHYGSLAEEFGIVLGEIRAEDL